MKPGSSLARCLRFALTALTLPLLARPAVALDWPGLGLDIARGRQSAEHAGPTFAMTGWRHELARDRDPSERELLSSPAVADGFVVIGTRFNQVQALREQDGKLLWTVGIKGPVTSSPAIDRGQVFVAAENGWLHALRLADGAELWRQNLGALVMASPAVVDGTLLLATGNPRPGVMRLHATTGEVIWRTAPDLLGQAAHASLAVGGDLVIVAEMTGLYHALGLADGTERWRASLGGMVNLSAPVIAGDRVFVATGGPGATVHALSLGDGQEVAGWPLILPAPDAEGTARRTWQEHILSSPAYGGGLLVLARRFDEHIDDGGDGVADRYTSREQIVFIDPAAPTVRATVASGRADGNLLGIIPAHAFCPTPAGFNGADDAPLWAVASSLEPTLRVLAGSGDVGAERGRSTLSQATRSSPAFANAQVLVGTDAGTLHALPSTSNRPPNAPLMGLWPTGNRAVDVAAVTITWGAAIDLDGGMPRYLLRVDDDGEILRDWDVELMTSPGQQMAVLSGALKPGHMYTFAVRAQDAAGALSSWSYASTFRVVQPPSISVDDKPAGNLADALAHAQPGSTISIGRGQVVLNETLRLPAGVTLAGAGPHLTTFDGTDLDVAVAPGAGSTLRQLRVVGARIGVAIDSTDVTLRNVILSDNTVAGLTVEPSGRAQLVSATVARNGIGVRARGATTVRNALITDNDVGVAAREPTAVQTSYSDVFANRTHNWEIAAPHSTDIDSAIAFEHGDDPFLLPQPAQPSTDRGAPADEWREEPAPNGSRINMGAYGNTPFAEKSARDIPEAPGADAGMATDAPGAESDASGMNPPPGADPSGCGCTVGRGTSDRAPMLPLSLVVAFTMAAWVRRIRGRRKSG